MFGDPARLGASVVVRPGIEVRAPGTLTVSAAVSLPNPVPGDGPVTAGGGSLSLRAAGDIQVLQSLSAGFEPTFGGSLATWVPSRGSSGSLTVVAGADLASANPLATTRVSGTTGSTGSTGSVTIGSTGGSFGTPEPTLIRTTTGAIAIAAAGDIVFANTASAVVSTGSADQAPSGAPDPSSLSFYLVPSTSEAGYVNPFLQHGGAISLQAGNDVVGTAPAPERPYVTEWWWRGNADTTAVWYARFDLFETGIGSFGGGDVRVSAGRDVRDLQAAASDSGWMPTTAAPAGPTRFATPGGSVAVAAGRDVLGGTLFAAGPLLAVEAGRDVAASASGTTGNGIELVHQQTQVAVRAQRDITVGAVRSAGLTQPSANSGAGDTVLEGLDTTATLQVTSALGQIDYQGRSQASAPGTRPSQPFLDLGALVPGQATFAAPSGSIALSGPLTQQPHADGQLDILAGQDVSVTALTVAVNRPSAAAVAEDASIAAARLAENTRFDGDQLDRSSRSPVRIVAEAGDVQLRGALSSVRPVRLIAGHDIVFTGGALLSVQQQAEVADPATGARSAVREVSLLQAGRDIALQGLQTSGIEIAGPGDLVLLAGRDIDLGIGSGVVALGNQRNSTLLPATGANLTLLAGVAQDGVDLVRAQGSGFQALGVSGLIAQPGAVYAALSPATTAAAFDAMPLAERLQSVAPLLGAGYDAALTRFVRSVPQWRGLTDAEARAAFDASSDTLHQAAIGALLAFALEARPAAERSAFLAAQLAPGSSPYAAGLIDYMKQVGGQALPLADAAVVFDALPIERRIPWLRSVLEAELRQAGRSAAQTDGDARQASYSAGYLALDALFPGTRVVGNISLPTSQVKTLQRADITLLAPGGDIDAGEVVAGAGILPKKPNELGIVTVAGGGIFAATGGDFAVNQSRVFTLQKGNVLLWSSDGNIDAGRGAKTVTGAPAPVLRLDDEGRLVLDTSGSFSGSGIAVLDSSSSLDLYAPRGEINAGEAGIQSRGTAFFGAVRLVGADDIQVAGSSVGGPPAKLTGGETAGLANAGQAAAQAGSTQAGEDDEDARKRKRGPRRSLLLDFLGFGGEKP